MECWFGFLLLFAYLTDIPFHFRIYEINTWFLLGGFLFGLGTAFNKGCGISTLTKLTKGDIKMLATITGWLAGWTIFAYWAPERGLIASTFTGNITLLTI